MIKSGLAAHCHHDRLFEFCYDFDERVAYIQENKPKEEQKLRLKMFFLFPEDRLPLALREATKAYREADKAYREADKAHEEAYKALREALAVNLPAIMALHDELCPNCTWDEKRQTIFKLKGG